TLTETVLMCLRKLAILGLMAFCLGTLPARAQSNGKSKSAQDPDDRWNERTGGRDVWVRAEITDPRQQRIFDSIAQKVGATNGVMYRQQHLDLAQRSTAPRPGSPVPAKPAPSVDPRTDPNSPAFDAYVASRFQRYDQNGDGLLNYDEMPDQLRAERD